jgi:hypothetical protein
VVVTEPNEEKETRLCLVEDLEAIRKHLIAMEGFYLTHFSDTQFPPELIEAGKRVFAW